MQSIKAKAFALLAKRAYFSKELARKLSDKGYPKEKINSLIDHLKEKGWLNDQELAKRFIERYQSKYGPKLIAVKLKEKAGNISLPIEESKEAIEMLLEKKYAKQLPEKKHTVIRALLRRGFSYEAISSALNLFE